MQCYRVVLPARLWPQGVLLRPDAQGNGSLLTQLAHLDGAGVVPPGDLIHHHKQPHSPRVLVVVAVAVVQRKRLVNSFQSLKHSSDYQRKHTHSFVVVVVFQTEITVTVFKRGFAEKVMVKFLGKITHCFYFLWHWHSDRNKTRQIEKQPNLAGEDRYSFLLVFFFFSSSFF